jgi:DNA repair protein RecN (Recombination protein N)
VRHGAERSDIHASFDVCDIPEAIEWLEQHDLHDSSEVLLRRVITREGRSRGYINGRPATLADLKTLGGMLIDIHSQHAHQSLLKKEQQRKLLDEYAGCAKLACELQQLANRHQRLQHDLHTRSSNRDEQSARAQLLDYQVGELDELALATDELEALEKEHRQLANGEQTLQASQHALALCREGEINVISILHQALRSISQIGDKTKALIEAEELLNSALIQAEEAGNSIDYHIDSFDLNPERLQSVEQRLQQIYDVARKHKVQPHQLLELHQQLNQELASLTGSDEQLDMLQAELQKLQNEYHSKAQTLSDKRASAAKKLQKHINIQLAELAMANCQFAIDLRRRDHNSPHPHGAEEVQFLVSTNPGQPPQPLAKTASGGELSRISLAIGVVTAKTSAIPTMVFDEVDVGIGGATAEVVGNLLQQLGTQGQVLCVTHQPQVASKGHQHLFVSKTASKKSVSTALRQLNPQEKIEEIARMLGGIAITDQSRAHAKEMLALH